jgi:hypothetical protein
VPEANLPGEAIAAVAGHPAVTRAALGGSRARREEVELSDWDIEVETTDLPALSEALPELVAPLAPLACQWDRLSAHPTYMLMLSGAIKLDYLFLDHENEPLPPWRVRSETLPGIDTHFWDWILWLAAKDAAGREALLAEQWPVLHEHLLEPLGVPAPPRSVAAAVAAYDAACTQQQRRAGLMVPSRLGDEVRARLRAAGYEV